MKPAIVIVDLLEGSFDFIKADNKEDERAKIIVPTREFLKECRKLSMPVIFACDSFLKDDFIFRGKMKPHAIRGTKGTMPLADLEPRNGDIILEKRRFSAFFKTDLDQTLRTMHVDTVVIGGINTHFCVIATAIDAVCHDFYTVILEDLSGAHKREIHRNFMSAYRDSALYPLFRVMNSEAFLEEFGGSVHRQKGANVPI